MINLKRYLALFSFAVKWLNLTLSSLSQSKPSFNLTNYLYNLSGTDHIAAALKFTYLYFTEMNIY